MEPKPALIFRETKLPWPIAARHNSQLVWVPFDCGTLYLTKLVCPKNVLQYVYSVTANIIYYMLIYQIDYQFLEFSILKMRVEMTLRGLKIRNEPFFSDPQMFFSQIEE